MTSTKPVPILTLPHSALKEVIHNFDPYEQINVSLCSNKSKSIMKRTIPKKGYEMSLNLSEEYSLIMVISDVFRFEIDSDFMNQRQKYPEPMGLNTFQSVKLMKWTDYICDLFDTSIKNLHISTMHSIHILKDISSWIKNRQEIYPEYSEIESPIGSSNDYNTFLLENFNANNLKASVHLEDTYETNLPFTHDKLMLTHSKWFTNTNLLTSNCSKIELYKTKVTAEGINAFLKGWIKGDYPKLEYLVLKVLWTNDNVFFDGVEIIEAEDERDEPERRQGEPVRHVYERLYGGVGEISGRKQIRRNDGVMATVESHGSRFLYPGVVMPLNELNELLVVDTLWFRLIANSLFLTDFVVPNDWIRAQN